MAAFLIVGAALTPSNGTIAITVLSCAPTTVPRLSLQQVTRDPNRDYSARVPLTFKSNGANIFTAHIFLREGMYLLGSDSQTCRMRSPVPVTILTGERRDVFIVLHTDQIVLLRELEPHTVVVNVANPDVGLELFTPGLPVPRRPSWSGANAYFDGVPSGKLLLEVASSDASVCIPIVVPSTIGSITKVDLSLSTLARLFAGRSNATRCPSRDH